MSQSRHSLIARWADEQSLAQPTGGTAARLAMTVDRVRVHLIELPSQNVLIEARITDLPLAAGAREKLLQRALSAATSRMHHSNLTLVADHEGNALCLQSRVEAQADLPTLSHAIERLVNEIELWRAAL